MGAPPQRTSTSPLPRTMMTCVSSATLWRRSPGLSCMEVPRRGGADVNSNVTALPLPADDLALRDPGGVALPIALPQEALVQLAGGQPGQLVHEVDGAGTLEVGEVLPAEGDELTFELWSGARRGVGHRLHHGLDLLAQVVVGHTDDGGV